MICRILQNASQYRGGLGSVTLRLEHAKIPIALGLTSLNNTCLIMVWSGFKDSSNMYPCMQVAIWILDYHHPFCLRLTMDVPLNINLDVKSKLEGCFSIHMVIESSNLPPRKWLNTIFIATNITQCRIDGLMCKQLQRRNSQFRWWISNSSAIWFDILGPRRMKGTSVATVEFILVVMILKASPIAMYKVDRPCM